MIGALDEIGHASGRVDRQKMLGKAGPWGDAACHFTSQSELFIRCCCKQGTHEVLQGDDTNCRLRSGKQAEKRLILIKLLPARADTITKRVSEYHLL